jgi:hypothetical protein
MGANSISSEGCCQRICLETYMQAKFFGEIVEWYQIENRIKFSYIVLNLGIFFKSVMQGALQQDVHSLTTCSWDHCESKSSNKHLQQFVKKMRMSILLHL